MQELPWLFRNHGYHLGAVACEHSCMEIILGNISDAELLASNLAENCISYNVDTMNVSSYDAFLLERVR